jgi:hypothetical protein
VLFILEEQHFASPPDWHLRCIDGAWFNSVITQIHVALAPVAPRAN